MEKFQHKTEARRIALQCLHQLDVQGEEFLISNSMADFIAEATADPMIRDIALAMAKGAWAYHATADQWFGRLAEKWPVHRMPIVDRNILRLAAWEITHEGDTPSKVALDEAINLGREFSTGESPSFINGILDALMKEHLSTTGKAL